MIQIMIYYLVLNLKHGPGNLLGILSILDDNKWNRLQCGFREAVIKWQIRIESESIKNRKELFSDKDETAYVNFLLIIHDI